ncbi:hypothetical protein AGABI2DRAFT_117066 [Agaricus bisporus var. bisporus H97]|uniref:hypothetical protein n=1 Tax=Agaricus bisporus var. bisporus (strain H97 / ATCC MYA-4626 / FGSC 10389) TaxID=936046 RepID=UPI00029F67D7|nr:hypothetical protein AGABI2DRAFT_117066 [Agaricus bisporus var. bisporus H97]EKV48241.1 hypothetical protein AGABI2DRAFT_117066 [Agaricus bisporus var. bisporus H97]
MTQQPHYVNKLKRKLAQWISDEYRGYLNGNHIQILDQPPSSLEFSRLIHIARPVIIKATRKWTNEYLVQKMGDQQISVAITPNGRADAITRGADNELYFVEPQIEQMTIHNLLSKLVGQDAPSDIHYLQSQNGNLYSSDYFTDGNSVSEYEHLREDVPDEVPWCTEALGRRPDAVNLWIGEGKSTTSIHSDPYENIYTVVKGEKRFTLLPPSDGWCLKERFYPHAKFGRSSSQPLEVIPSTDVPPVRWSSITDPSIPGSLPANIKPLHVCLKRGETLYLPAGWWHYVQQGKEMTIAINWWYDMEMRGVHWVFLNLLRNEEGLFVDSEDRESDPDS